MPIQDVFWTATRKDIHWGIWSGAVLIALIILGRTAANAIPEMHPLWVLAIAAGVLGCNLLTWWWSLPEAAGEPPREQIARGGIAVFPALILGVVLAGASTAGLIGVLSIVGGGLTFVVVHVQQRTTREEGQQIVSTEPAFQFVAQEMTQSESRAAMFDDPLVQQQIIRRRTEHGADSLEALLRIEFAARQREASIHLPFQPAFSALPEVECEPLEDADIELKVGTVHPYGVRIDVKRLGQDLDWTSIAVGILIQSAAGAEAAA